MTAVSGPGGWPGLDVLAAQRTVLDDLAEVPAGLVGRPWAVRLPSRGPQSSPAGHAVSLLAQLPVELGPHGWKLADRPGVDLARGLAERREELDALAVAGLGWTGPLVVPVLGPLSLAASTYLARGDRVVADAGALEELAVSLAEGLAERLAAVARAVPGVTLEVLLHEPLLAQVVAGVLPTFSGYSVLRAVPGPLAAERLGAVVAAVRAAGATTVVHPGTSWTAVRTVLAAGAEGLALAVDGLDVRGWEQVAEAVETGQTLWPELPRQQSSSCAGPDVAGQAQALLRPWRSVGLPDARLRDVTLLTAAPTAQTSVDEARAELAGLARAALIVAERAEGGT